MTGNNQKLEKIRKSFPEKERPWEQKSLPEVVMPDALNGVDFSEFVGEQVSEMVSEAEEKAKAGKAGTAQKAKKVKKMTQEQIRAYLIASKPSEEQMKREISAKLGTEMKNLKKKLSRIKDKIGQAFEVTKIIAKMRQLKEILAAVKTATYEVLKSIWLKVVHGIL